MDRSNIRIVYEIGIHGEPYEISRSCQYNINTHSFDIFSLKNKFWSILVPSKVAAPAETPKSEVFCANYQHPHQKTIKTVNKQTRFSQNQRTKHQIRFLANLRSAKPFSEVFKKILDTPGVKRYIIKTNH